MPESEYMDSPIPAPIRAVLLLAAIVALVWAVAILPTERYHPAAVDGVVQLGGEIVDRRAIDFELPGLDGQTHRLSEQHEELVFLNFWASWCEPCREEMPAMARLARSLSRQSFLMVAVSIDEDPEAMVAFLREHEIDTGSMLILHDPSGESALRYGTELLPETFLLDGRGRIIARFQGAYDWDAQFIRIYMERLLRHPWKA